MIRPARSPRCVAPRRAPSGRGLLAAALLVPALLAAPLPALAARDTSAFPALLTLAAGSDGVRATSGPDAAGARVTLAFDRATGTWSAPAPVPDPAPDAPRLDQVLVFSGGLFDQFPDRDRIDLGGGFALARRDTGVALIENGVDRGWPAVREDEIDAWGHEVRLGLPRDYPEDRLRQLLATGQLRNVPGPFARLGDTLWFGLAGGFTGGDGQLGGLVAYDVTRHAFRVVRHKFIVDAAVTRLLPVGDELWIGTGRFGPTRLEGLRGMLVHRPKRREWRQFSPDNSRIAGDLVYDAATDGRTVWVTTDQGVSRYDLGRRLWTSWYWHGTADGFRLTGELPGDLARELIK